MTTKLTIILTIVLSLVACTNNTENRIKIDGSATVLPITQAVVEDFAKENRGIEISVSASGTGGGFKKFTNDETDIQNASREIKTAESDVATQKGVSYYEIVVAKDAIVIAVNKENTWVANLSSEQLYEIFKADSSITKWSDIDADYPDEKINFYIPATDSGTFDYFHSTIMKKDTEVRADATASQDLNVLVTGVEGDRNAIGFFSYAYYTGAKDRINAVTVDGVAPEKENIANGKYQPLSRSLYIYINKNKYSNKDVMQKFVSYYLTHAAELSEEAGFIPLTPKEYEKEQSKLRKI